MKKPRKGSEVFIYPGIVLTDIIGNGVSIPSNASRLGRACP